MTTPVERDDTATQHSSVHREGGAVMGGRMRSESVSGPIAFSTRLTLDRARGHCRWKCRGSLWGHLPVVRTALTNSFGVLHVGSVEMVGKDEILKSAGRGL